MPERPRRVMRRLGRTVTTQQLLYGCQPGTDLRRAARNSLDRGLGILRQRGQSQEQPRLGKRGIAAQCGPIARAGPLEIARLVRIDPAHILDPWIIRPQLGRGGQVLLAQYLTRGAHSQTEVRLGKCGQHMLVRGSDAAPDGDRRCQIAALKCQQPCLSL
jgi:hypothetical protein